MFEKERELLSVGWKFDFVKFESAIERRKKYESTLGNVQAKVAEALDKAKDCRTHVNSPDCSVAVRNEENVKALYAAITEWQSLYDVLCNMSKTSPKAFEEKSVAASMKELATYEAPFKKYMDTQAEFMVVVAFVKKLASFGSLTEKNVKPICEVIEENENRVKSAYLPSDTISLIAKAKTMRDTIEALEDYYERVENHIDHYWQAEHDPSAVSIAASHDQYERYARTYEGGISANMELQQEFADLKGDRSLSIFGLYEEKYEPRLQETLELLRDRLSALQAAFRARRGGISARGVIARILGILMYAMIIAAALCTVINTIIVFGGSINWFWAVLFGLIVGILFAVVRVAAMYGLGALWWPSAFATMFFGPKSLEVNKAVLIFNIVFLVISFLYAELTIYREDRDLRNGSSSGIRALAMGVPFIGTCALVIATLWSGIAGLVRIWNIWGIFEVFCGFFFGLFRVIMLIIGAGFWWPSLFSVTGDNGAILNAAFYILLVIFGVYGARQKD